MAHGDSLRQHILQLVKGGVLREVQLVEAAERRVGSHATPWKQNPEHHEECWRQSPKRCTLAQQHTQTILGRSLGRHWQGDWLLAGANVDTSVELA